MTEETAEQIALRKKREKRLVAAILVFLFPLLAIAIVGGYGFAMWMLQMIFGPPGPPGH
ncbi:periplasmic nitrate reductase, NapE protein [Microbulbifer halophilus]|uniref:Periplasmic nitrate reductase, NapE protein n=1 Tax=Microbulbifer halophilus TaxID=453963 RepID=A0ABW5E5X4_9GAMM